jgi:peptide/nickel transport system substrate-binding protein
VEEVGDEAIALAPMGTGPYIFDSWTPGSDVRGHANESYWNEAEKAVTPNIQLKFISESSGRVIELETGNADIVYDIASADFQLVEDLENAHVATGPSFRYYCVTFSMQDETLANKDLRYALSLAIDKEALTKAVFGDTAVAAYGYIPASSFGFKDTGVLPYDPDEAKRLIARAGYPDGFTLDFKYESREVDIRLAEAIQNMWGQIGVNVESYAMDSKTYLAQGKTFQIGMRAGNAVDPESILIIYDSAFEDLLQPNNPQLDDDLHEAAAIYDPEKRAAKYAGILDWLYDARYSVPLSFTNAIFGISDNVANFEYDPNRSLRLNTIKVYK